MAAARPAAASSSSLAPPLRASHQRLLLALPLRRLLRRHHHCELAIKGCCSPRRCIVFVTGTTTARHQWLLLALPRTITYPTVTARDPYTAHRDGAFAWPNRTIGCRLPTVDRFSTATTIILARSAGGARLSRARQNFPRSSFSDTATTPPPTVTFELRRPPRASPPT